MPELIGGTTMDIHELFRPPTPEEIGEDIWVSEEEYARIKASEQSMTTKAWIESLGKL
jgi:hypothetical protein